MCRPLPSCIRWVSNWPFSASSRVAFGLMALDAWRKQDTPNCRLPVVSKWEVSELSVAQLPTPSKNIFKSRMPMAFPPWICHICGPWLTASIVSSGCPTWLPFCRHLLSQLPAAKHVARLSIEQAGCPIFATGQDPLAASRYISTWGLVWPEACHKLRMNAISRGETENENSYYPWSCEAKLKKMSMLPCSCFFLAKQWDKMSNS